MTKSRTLRKAAAVALSLAMAFSVATVSTDASAAAKPSLKKTSVSVKAKKTVKVGIKNYKLVKKVTVKVKNSKVASAKAVGKKAIKITGKKAGKTKVVVTIKYTSGKKTKTLKKNITVKVAKAATDDDGTVVTESLKVVDLDGYQTDGTAAIGDRLQVQIPASIGTIDRINWYIDDKLDSTSSSEGDDSIHGATKAGVWVARVVTTKGTTYSSDSVTVSDKETRATVSGFAIADDYEDSNIDFDDKDGQAIVDITLSKDYAGTFRFFAEKDGKISNKTTVATVDVVKGNPITQQNPLTYTYAGSTEKFTNHALYADPHTTKVAANAPVGANTKAVSNTGINKVTNKDGSVTYRFFVASAAGGFKRGSSYVALFDQTNVIDDDENSATPNITNAFTAPYVTAPAALSIEPISKDMPIKVDFVDAEGKKLEWLGAFADAGNAIGDLGISEVKVFADTSSAVSDKSGTKEEIASANTTNKVVKGVIKTTAKADSAAAPATFNGKSNYIATAKFKKDVYGAADVPLTSKAASTNADVVGNITKMEPATDPKNLTLEFSNVRADATVYFITGSYDKDNNTGKSATDNIESFDPANPGNVKSVEIAKNSEKATIEGAFEKVLLPEGNQTPAQVDKANTYGVIIVPKDMNNFGMVKKSDGVLQQKITKFELKSAVNYTNIKTTTTTGFWYYTLSSTTDTLIDPSFSAPASQAVDTLVVKDQYTNAIAISATRASIAKEYTLKKAADGEGDNTEVTLRIVAGAAGGTYIAVDAHSAVTGKEYTATAGGMKFTFKASVPTAIDAAKGWTNTTDPFGTLTIAAA